MEPTIQQTQSTGGKNTLIAITVLIILVIAGVFYLAKKTEQETSIKTDTVNTAQDNAPQAMPQAPVSVASAIATSSDSKSYTMAEVATHNTATSCWTVVSGQVYDLTGYENKHPGGKKAVLRLCGTDGTANFTAQHGGKKGPMGALDKLKIGVLQQ